MNESGSLNETPKRTHRLQLLLTRYGFNTHLLHYGFRAWFIEIMISGFNFFVLMNMIYEPRVGYLAAHQIGMATRIVYIFIIAYFLLRKVKQYNTKDLVHVGFFWLGMTLAFEWEAVSSSDGRYRRSSKAGTYSLGICGHMC